MTVVVVVCGLGVLLAMAVMIGFVETGARDTAWRRIAAERRTRAETARQLEHRALYLDRRELAREEFKCDWLEQLKADEDRIGNLKDIPGDRANISATGSVQVPPTALPAPAHDALDRLLDSHVTYVEALASELSLMTGLAHLQIRRSHDGYVNRLGSQVDVASGLADLIKRRRRS